MTTHSHIGIFGRLTVAWPVVALSIALAGLRPNLCSASASLTIFWPRGGLAKFSTDAGSGGLIFPWELATSDTDETKSLFFSSPRLLVDFTTGATEPTEVTGELITQPPHSVDGLDWAAAMSIYNPLGQIEFYFQMRSAGSTAVIDTTGLPAVQHAIAAGLWTSANDYFEFPLEHAGIGQRSAPPAGPGSFISFVLPEPASVVLLCAAVAIAAGAQRRFAKRQPR